MQSKQRGLTLVELMVVVAVMAIIASIAYPLYSDQVQKSRRADAKVALQSIALAQERFYTVNGNYAATLASLQVSRSLRDDDLSDQRYYDISVAVAGADASDFTATATPVASGPQASDGDCAQFTINQLGVKLATDGNDTNCW